MIDILIKQAFENNWFKIFTPKNLGGIEASLPDGLNILIETAKINPSLGWIVDLGSGAGYFWAFFSKEASENLMKSPEFLIAGSGQVKGKAIKVEDGFLVSGKWPKCSGSAYATHFTVNAVDEEGNIKSFTLKKDSVSIINDWTYFGLLDTSTYSIECQNAFVPRQYVFEIGKVLQSEHKYKIHQLPFIIFAKYCLTATFCGIAHFFFNRVMENEIVKERVGVKTLNLFYKSLTELNEHLLELANKDWQVCKTQQLSNTQNAANLYEMSKENKIIDFIREIYKLACEIYYLGGMPMANKTEPVHQAWCDLLTAVHHSYLK